MKLETVLNSLSFDPPPQFLEQVKQLQRLLYLVNESINLTRISFDDFLEYHVIDSLQLCSVVELPECKKLLDIGCGPGFPGLPLSLLLPGLDVTCLDSTFKKIAFIRNTARALGAQNIQAIHDRAEVAAHSQEHRERYEIVTCRALGSFPLCIELCAGFASVGSAIVLFRGPDAPEELAEHEACLSILGLSFARLHQYALSDGVPRYLVLLTREGPLDSEFPRDTKHLQNQPLKPTKS